MEVLKRIVAETFIEPDAGDVSVDDLPGASLQVCVCVCVCV